MMGFSVWYPENLYLGKLVTIRKTSKMVSVGNEMKIIYNNVMLSWNLEIFRKLSNTVDTK